MDRPHFVDPPICWWLMCILHRALWGVIKWLRQCEPWSQATWVSILVVVVQLLSRADSLWPHGLQHTRLLCPPLSPRVLKFMSIESVMLSNHLILCSPLLLLLSIFPSIRVFSNESDLRIRWPKYWSFIFNISPSNECSGLLSFRNDWFDLLEVQGTLKSLLQHHSSKA